MQGDRSEQVASVTYALHGDIDVSNADGIRGAASQAVTAGRSRLVLDLADVDFMDSQGLKALLDAQRTLRVAGASLVLANPRPPVQRLFELTALDGYFEVL